jgi:hypothetical protein
LNIQDQGSGFLLQVWRVVQNPLYSRSLSRNLHVTYIEADKYDHVASFDHETLLVALKDESGLSEFNQGRNVKKNILLHLRWVFNNRQDKTKIQELRNV